jgi:hypothetical protein
VSTIAPSAPATPPIDAGFHAVQRRLAALLPEAETVGGTAALELSSFMAQEKPRLDPPEILEGTRVAAIDIAGEPVAHFAAFLDGTQTSRVTHYIAGVPIVHGTVAAVVRERRDRRMTTWRAPLVNRRLYAPLAMLTPSAAGALAASGAEVIDTTAKREIESIHPFALQDAALQAVQRDRSALERALAEAWVEAQTEMLFIDGGISESAQVATSASVVGVVKTHQQLYVHGDDLATVLRLRAGQRTSVTRVSPRSRTPVASWYLRLRDPQGRDPLWGLVRVEIAEPKGATPRQMAGRAELVSRWVMAETLPLALPDGRWDKMVYGIRDCEEFLRAIQ